MGGGGHPGVSYVIQKGDTSCPAVQVGFLGAVIHDDKGGGGHPHGGFKPDHQEAGKLSGRKDLGETDSVGVPTGGGDEVGGRVHWQPEGEGGTLGFSTTNPVDMCELNGMRGRGQESKVVVEAANNQ